jgi:hypothetical protein
MDVLREKCSHDKLPCAAHGSTPSRYPVRQTPVFEVLPLPGTITDRYRQYVGPPICHIGGFNHGALFDIEEAKSSAVIAGLSAAVSFRHLIMSTSVPVDEHLLALPPE